MTHSRIPALSTANYPYVPTRGSLAKEFDSKRKLAVTLVPPLGPYKPTESMLAKELSIRMPSVPLTLGSDAEQAPTPYHPSPGMLAKETVLGSRP